MTKTEKTGREEFEDNILLGLFIAFIISCLVIVFLTFANLNLKAENEQLREQIDDTFPVDLLGNPICPIIINGTPVNCEVKEGKVIITKVKSEEDYHSSGELFCEHYGGKYKKEFLSLNYGHCYFNINDTIGGCSLIKSQNRKEKSEYYLFYGGCEVIQ